MPKSGAVVATLSNPLACFLQFVVVVGQGGPGGPDPIHPCRTIHPCRVDVDVEGGREWCVVLARPPARTPGPVRGQNARGLGWRLVQSLGQGRRSPRERVSESPCPCGSVAALHPSIHSTSPRHLCGAVVTEENGNWAYILLSSPLLLDAVLFPSSSFN